MMPYKTAFVGYVFSLLILGLFLLCSDVTGATEEGLIAHWPLDGDAKDASRNGHDGVIQGAKWVDGHTGKAAEFLIGTKLKLSASSIDLARSQDLIREFDFCDFGVFY